MRNEREENTIKPKLGETTATYIHHKIDPKWLKKRIVNQSTDQPEEGRGCTPVRSTATQKRPR